MQRTTPKRIIFRFHEKYQFDEAAIIEAFFASFGLKPADDYYSHFYIPNEPTKMRIILEIYAKIIPTFIARVND